MKIRGFGVGTWVLVLGLATGACAQEFSGVNFGNGAANPHCAGMPDDQGSPGGGFGTNTGTPGFGGGSGGSGFGGGGGIFSNPGGLFGNGGTFRKLTGTGTTTIGAPYDRNA